MSKKTSILTKVAFLVIILFLVVQIFGVLGKLDREAQAKADMKAEIAALQAAIADKEYRIEHSDDDDVIEDVARDNGMVMPGEQIYE
jgi:cell division protein FtsB